MQQIYGNVGKARSTALPLTGGGVAYPSCPGNSCGSFAVSWLDVAWRERRLVAVDAAPIARHDPSFNVADTGVIGLRFSSLKFTFQRLNVAAFKCELHDLAAQFRSADT